MSAAVNSHIAVIGAGFRQLDIGELIQAGDQYHDPNDGRWYPSKSVGKAVGTPYCTTSTYRRAVKA